MRARGRILAGDVGVGGDDAGLGDRKKPGAHRVETLEAARRVGALDDFLEGEVGWNAAGCAAEDGGDRTREGEEMSRDGWK